MEDKQQFLDYEGLTEYHKKSKAEMKASIKTEINAQISGFISYTNDTAFEALEGAV